MRFFVRVLMLASLLNIAMSANNGKVIEVFESPTCGCCDKWVEYMRGKGYTLKVQKSTEFYKIKEKYNIKSEYQSCHTGVINGYVLEGHIPLGALEWLLKNKPKNAIGITAPGMPQGSPGMEQGVYEDYPVILLLKNGDYEMLGIYNGDKLVQEGKIEKGKK
ncbi:DUF411 domain-containing protein [Helicobacter sp. T3_23-1056]